MPFGNKKRIPRLVKRVDDIPQREIDEMISELCREDKVVGMYVRRNYPEQFQTLLKNARFDFRQRMREMKMGVI